MRTGWLVTASLLLVAAVIGTVMVVVREAGRLTKPAAVAIVAPPPVAPSVPQPAPPPTARIEPKLVVPPPPPPVAKVESAPPLSASKEAAPPQAENPIKIEPAPVQRLEKLPRDIALIHVYLDILIATELGKSDYSLIGDIHSVPADKIAECGSMVSSLLAEIFKADDGKGPEIVRRVPDKNHNYCATYYWHKGNKPLSAMLSLWGFISFSDRHRRENISYPVLISEMTLHLERYALRSAAACFDIWKKGGMYTPQIEGERETNFVMLHMGMLTRDKNVLDIQKSFYFSNNFLGSKEAKEAITRIQESIASFRKICPDN